MTLLSTEGERRPKAQGTRDSMDAAEEKHGILVASCNMVLFTEDAFINFIPYLIRLTGRRGMEKTVHLCNNAFKEGGRRNKQEKRGKKKRNKRGKRT